MEYHVAKTEIIDPAIDSAEWEKAPLGLVNQETWALSPISPKTTFQLLLGPEGISVRMHTEETHLRDIEREENGAICKDSCMEFFFKPSPWDTRYFNFELNPSGVLHLGLGPDRFHRTLLAEDRKTFRIVSLAKEGDWWLKYYIPFSFIEKHFPDYDKDAQGNKTHILKGNFYKCGDCTDHLHYASWSRIDVEKPDFHLPDFFGRILF